MLLKSLSQSEVHLLRRYLNFNIKNRYKIMPNHGMGFTSWAFFWFFKLIFLNISTLKVMNFNGNRSIFWCGGDRVGFRILSGWEFWFFSPLTTGLCIKRFSMLVPIMSSKITWLREPLTWLTNCALYKILKLISKWKKWYYLDLYSKSWSYPQEVSRPPFWASVWLLWVHFLGPKYISLHDEQRV